MRGRSWLRQCVAQLVLSLVCAVVLYPVLWVVKMAVTPSQSFSSGGALSWETVSWENFSFLLFDTQGLFFRQLLNSVIVSFATTLVGVALATTAAYAFSRFVFVGRKQALASFLITQMFPGVVMAIPLYILLDTLSLLNSLVGLILVYSTTSVPFCVWMLKGYFDTIPKDLEEAALIDGATRWQIFWRIVLPLAKPAIVVTALFSFMTAWNEFILAATFLSDERMFTLPVVLQRYVGDYSTQWGYFAAGAVLVSLPVMALFFALQRFLIGGLTAGAIKG